MNDKELSLPPEVEKDLVLQSAPFASVLRGDPGLMPPTTPIGAHPEPDPLTLPEFCYMKADEARDWVLENAQTQPEWKCWTRGDLAEMFGNEPGQVEERLQEVQRLPLEEQAKFAIQNHMVHPKLLCRETTGQPVVDINWLHCIPAGVDAVGRFRHKVFSDADLLFVFPDVNTPELQQRLDELRWMAYSTGTAYGMLRWRVRDPEERAAVVDRLARFELWREVEFVPEHLQEVDCGKWGFLSLWELENRIWWKWFTLESCPPRHADKQALHDLEQLSSHPGIGDPIGTFELRKKIVQELAEETGLGEEWAEGEFESARLWRDTEAITGAEGLGYLNINSEMISFQEVYAAVYGPPHAVDASLGGPLGPRFGGAERTFSREVWTNESEEPGYPERWRRFVTRDNGVLPNWTGEQALLRELHWNQRGFDWWSAVGALTWPWLTSAQIDEHIYYPLGYKTKVTYESIQRYRSDQIVRAFGAWKMWNARTLQYFLDLRMDFTMLLDRGWHPDWIVEMSEYLHTHEQAPEEGFREVDAVGPQRWIAGPHLAEPFEDEEEKDRYIQFGDRSWSKLRRRYPETDETGWKMDDHFPIAVVPYMVEVEGEKFPVRCEHTDPQLIAKQNCMLFDVNEGIKVLPLPRRLTWRAVTAQDGYAFPTDLVNLTVNLGAEGVAREYPYSRLTHVKVPLDLQKYWFPGTDTGVPPPSRSVDERTDFALRHHELQSYDPEEPEDPRLPEDTYYYYALTPYQMRLLLQQQFYIVGSLAEDITSQDSSPDLKVNESTIQVESSTKLFDWETKPDATLALPEPEVVARFFSMHTPEGVLDLEKAEFWIGQACVQSRLPWFPIDEEGQRISTQDPEVGVIDVPEGRPRLTYSKLYARLFVGRWGVWDCAHMWLETLHRAPGERWSQIAQLESVQMEVFEVWRWVWLWGLYNAPRIVFDELLPCASPAEIRCLTRWPPTVCVGVYNWLHSQTWVEPSSRHSWERPFRDPKTGVRPDWLRMKYGKGSGKPELSEGIGVASGSDAYWVLWAKDQDVRYKPIEVPNPNWYTLDATGSDASFYWRFVHTLREMYHGDVETHPRDPVTGIVIPKPEDSFDVWNEVELS